MDTADYFSQLIDECRLEFRRSKPGFLHWLGLKKRPNVTEKVHVRLHRHYKLLAEKGRVVWGGIAQVNMMMFFAGNVDLPGVTVYSTDSHFDTHPQDLSAIGHACFEFKNTVPVDTEYQAIAERLTDEFDQTARMQLPKQLADGRKVFLGATMFHRNRLPTGVLQASVFPMVIAPKLTEINMVLPLAYWPVALRDNWGELKQELARSPTTTTAGYIAQKAEKRAIEHGSPDWDTSAVPIKVTKAMAEEFRSMVRKMNLESIPYLFVGFRDDGKKGADLALYYDPRIEQTFTSNGIKVVVRKDQLERLRGVIVDFKCSTFAKGIVIRLPGE